MTESERRAWSALRWLATEYFSPDSTGRYGLPITVRDCRCDELDTSCGHVVAAQNRAFEVEAVLREASLMQETR